MDHIPLRRFVQDATRIVDRNPPVPVLLPALRDALRILIERDGWLAPEAAVARGERYSQYLLHYDPLERFSVVSFVWGPGQHTPIHDHTVWGLVGLLQGQEVSSHFNRHEGGALEPAEAVVLNRGDIELIEPAAGDIHQVCNGLFDDVSISIHVYGANIGRLKRHVFQIDGQARDFISGYNNSTLPNIWS